MSALYSFHDVFKSYDEGGKTLEILKGVNMDIAEGEQLAIVGASGSGKSTLLRCVNRLVGVILDRFGLDAILVPDGPDHFTVTIAAVVSPQFWGWLFGLGDGVTLLRPQWAVDLLTARLKEIAALYGV